MPHRRIIRRIRLIGPHLGRRGMILATLGTFWVITGLATWVAPDPSAAYPLLATAHTLRATVWVATGIIAIIYARRPQGRDAAGWLALYFMAAWRVIAYGHGFLLWCVGAEGASFRAIFGIASWASLIVVIRVCSGWPEHPEDQATTGAMPIIDPDRR